MAFLISPGMVLPGDKDKIIEDPMPTCLLSASEALVKGLLPPNFGLLTTRVPYKSNTGNACIFSNVTSGVVGDAAWVEHMEPDIVKLLLSCWGQTQTPWPLPFAGHQHLTNEAEVSAFVTSIERWVIALVEKLLGSGSLTSLREVGKETGLQGLPIEGLKADFVISFCKGKERTQAQIVVEAKPPGVLSKFLENTADNRNMHAQLRTYASLFKLDKITVIDGLMAKVVRFKDGYDGPVHVWHADYNQFAHLLTAQIFRKWYERELAATVYRNERGDLLDNMHGILFSETGALLVTLVNGQWHYSRDGEIATNQSARYWLP